MAFPYVSPIATHTQTHRQTDKHARTYTHTNTRTHRNTHTHTNTLTHTHNNTCLLSLQCTWAYHATRSSCLWKIRWSQSISLQPSRCHTAYLWTTTTNSLVSWWRQFGYNRGLISFFFFFSPLCCFMELSKGLQFSKKWFTAAPARSKIPLCIPPHMCRLFTEKRNSRGMAVHKGLGCYGY